jgi:hypothetical protein
MGRRRRGLVRSLSEARTIRFVVMLPINEGLG